MTDDRGAGGGPEDTGSERGGPDRRHEATGEGRAERDDGPGSDDRPGGPFPTWRSLYTTLIAYGALSIAILWLLTLLMNRGGTP